MALFGLACEGVTDQAVIENMLCGYFENEDLEEDIQCLQPLFDATDEKGLGGWTRLLDYLTTTRFRDDVLNNNYFIIQLDTDISQKKNFDVPRYDENNQELSVEDFVPKVIERLVIEINKGENNFYQVHKDKIMFCISVHSIECWLLAHYKNPKPTNPKIKGCEKALNFLNLKKQGLIPLLNNRYKSNIIKTYHLYQALSEPFLDKKILTSLSLIEPSLNLFLNEIKKCDL